MPTQTPSSARRPRFDASFQKLNVQLTHRDRSIFSTLAQHRFLTAPQIVRLLGGSAKKLTERIGQLYYAGYLTRPPA
ncbi:MAG: hypothetical protein ACRD9W_05790, partial [Terriglobia bacterium]